MKRKPRFFVGFLAAAITFGTLMATMGPHHFKHHNHHCYDKQCEDGLEKNKQDASPGNANENITQ